jgi:hypothetical protein
METTKSFDETRVAVLLIGSPEEQLAGLRVLDQEYRPKVFAYLRAYYPGLDSNALAECYSDAVADVACQVVAYHKDCSKSNFDPDKPLLPYLKTIAWRRAADRVRPQNGPGGDNSRGWSRPARDKSERIVEYSRPRGEKGGLGGRPSGYCNFAFPTTRCLGGLC